VTTRASLTSTDCSSSIDGLPQHPAVSVLDADDEVGVGVEALRRVGPERRGHLERGEGVDAERERRVGRHGLALAALGAVALVVLRQRQAGAVGRVDDPVAAGLLLHLEVDGVRGGRGRLVDGLLAVVAAAVVVDGVLVAALVHLDLELGRGRQRRLGGVARLGEGLEGERLEARPRLARAHHGGVELLLSDVRTADEREDPPGGGLDRDDGAGVGRALGHGVREHRLGGGLHRRVEVRVDAQPAEQLALVELVDARELTPDRVEVVGVGAELDTGPVRDVRDALGHGRVVVGLADPLLLEHPGERHLPATVDPVGVLGRVEVGGRGDHAGQGRGLVERQLRGVDVEVGLRGRLDAVRAAAPVDRVEVEAEDLVLGVLAFELDGERRLLDLAGVGLLGADRGVLDVLLGDRRAALTDRAAAHVGEQRAADPAGGDPPVLVEVAVLDTHHGLRYVLGQLVQRHVVAGHLGGEPADLLAVAVVDDRGRRRDVVGERDAGEDEEEQQEPGGGHEEGGEDQQCHPPTLPPGLAGGRSPVRGPAGGLVAWGTTGARGTIGHGEPSRGMHRGERQRAVDRTERR
jgi:hypothetical protein